MSSIVVGFGGTGAKMVQSFVLLAASGALKLARPVKVLLVDQDKGNGNTQRTAELIDLYLKLQKMVEKVADTRPFNVKLEVYSDIVWQPLRQTDITMGKFFRHTEDAGREDIASLLLDVLYTREELTRTTLGEGFRGHPSLGAPIFAETLDFSADPWHRLWQDIEQGVNGPGATVVLCGSIFGGTGAAGIPSTCKLLRERLDKLGAAGKRGRIVLNLALPYFTIREKQGAGLQANGKHFAANSKAALEYYHDARYLEFCDEIYLTGENDPAPIELASLGGKTQRNASHPLELFAACNVAHAVREGRAHGLVLTQRALPKTYQWSDLPLNDDTAVYGQGYVRARLGAFARTCYAMQSMRFALDGYKANAAVGDLAWLLDYFPDTKQLNAEDIKLVQRFSQLFLEWVGELELSAASIVNDEKPYSAEWFNADHLVNGSPADMSVHLKPINPDLMSTILLPSLQEERYSFRQLHHDLQRKPAGSARPGIAGLICDVYAAAGKTLPAFAAQAVNTTGGTHA